MDIHANPRLEFNRILVGADRYPLYPALGQSFIKHSQLGALLSDEVQNIIDSGDVLLPGRIVKVVFPPHVSELKNSVGNFLVVLSADVVLPGVSYAEKEGTFSNTERRVQRVRKAVTLDGEMRPDTEIFIDLMNRMGYPQPFLRPDEIMDEIASLTPSFAGISHRRLDAGESLQWPCTSRDHPGTPILHVGKFTRGIGWFYPARYCESRELPDVEYPFIMMTGRILYHYNTMAMTGKTRGLVEKEGHSFIEINTEDARRLGIADREQAKLTSRRGSIESQARVSDKVSPGETWMPFHFPDGLANILTNAALDKYARISEYKVCAIRIDKLP